MTRLADKGGILRGSSALLFTASLGVSSCRQVVGIDDPKPAEPSDAGTSEARPDSATSCQIPLRDDACGACMADHCCGELSACATNLACTQVHTCLLGCSPSDGSCRASCMTGADEFTYGDDVTACRFEHCQTACQAYCGGWEYRLDTCDVCMQQACCTEGQACGASSDCRSLERCLQLCPAGDTACYQACNLSHSEDAYEQDQAYYSCYIRNCGAECGKGRLWTCVGGNAGVSTEPKEIELTLGFFTFPGSPVEGATVKACTSLDAQCQEPIDEGTTDPDGEVLLNVPVGKYGFAGWFLAEADGHVTATVVYDPRLTYLPINSGFFLPTEAQFEAVVTKVGASLDPTRGHVAVLLKDCGTLPATGLTVSGGDGSAEAFYLNDNLEPSDELKATGAEGIAGFYNVPPGDFAFEATEVATDRVVISSQTTVTANAISYIVAYPK